MFQRSIIKYVVLLGVILAAGAMIASFSQLVKAAELALPQPPAEDPQVVVIAWNDLGMHCYNRDFQDLAVLPPFNTLWAQVIQVGDPPQVITTGLTVEYSFADNHDLRR